MKMNKLHLKLDWQYAINPWKLLNALAATLSIFTIVSQFNVLEISNNLKIWLKSYNTVIDIIFSPLDFFNIHFSVLFKNLIIISQIIVYPSLRQKLFPDDQFGDVVAALILCFFSAGICYLLILKLGDGKIPNSSFSLFLGFVASVAILTYMALEELEDINKYVHDIFRIFGIIVVVIVINAFFI